MMERIITAIVINGAVVFLFSFYYYLFGKIMVNIKGKTIKKVRKKYRGFWKKFLYLDFKNRIANWHYSLFIVFLVSSIILLILFNILAFSDFPVHRGLLVIVGCTFSFPYLIVGKSIDFKNRRSKARKH